LNEASACVLHVHRIAWCEQSRSAVTLFLLSTTTPQHTQQGRCLQECQTTALQLNEILHLAPGRGGAGGGSRGPAAAGCPAHKHQGAQPTSAVASATRRRKLIGGHSSAVSETQHKCGCTCTTAARKSINMSSDAT
jgi:hypothetical protein